MLASIEKEVSTTLVSTEDIYYLIFKGVDLSFKNTSKTSTLACLNLTGEITKFYIR